MDENIINVPCDYCGREIPCPTNMMDAEKHICYYCLEEKGDDFSEEEKSKIHIAMPTAELDENMAKELTDDIVETVFPEVWRERKDELKEVSKQELAEEMFGAGAYIALAGFLRKMREEEIIAKEQEGAAKEEK